MKSYQFEIDDYFIGGSTAIRDKLDIIHLLIGTVKYLSSLTLEELRSVPKNSITLIIYIDKMSRIFYCQDEKIHTFQFPFSVFEENGFLKIYYKDIELDSKLSTILLSIFSDSNKYIESLDSMLDLSVEVMRDYEITDKFYNEICWNLVQHLLSFEPGYLRFDHDSNPKRLDPIAHPLNHLDMYYSSQNTFKIGLNLKLDKDDLISILNINNNCKFIK